MNEVRNAELVRQTGKKLSNWGKWGADDEHGTLNYITPDCIVEATRHARKGRVFRLGLNYDKDGPELVGSDLLRRFNPIHLMLAHGGDAAIGAYTLPGGAQFADDIVIMPLQSATHWDSLAHVFYDGKLYNGYSMAETTGTGARRNSIDKACDGIIGRGVLLDIARSQGKDILETDHGITPEELDACAERQGVTIRQGDIICIRTGFIQKLLRENDKKAYTQTWPGLSFECVHWLSRHKVAAVTADTIGLEVFPCGFEDDCFLPLHMVTIRDIGMPIGEMFNFEVLSADSAADKIYEFFFIGTPLPITGAVGSPVNPLAVK